MLKVGPSLSKNSVLILLQDVSIINELNKEKYKYAYISTITHELSTPLNPILNSFEMIEMSNANAEQIKYIKIGKHSVKILSNFIQNSIVYK